MFYVGTTEAARLLGISTARVRWLLKKDRIEGAYKPSGGRFWLIPVFENGMPSVRRGARGPKPKWKTYRNNRKTIIHAYRNQIGKKDENGEYKPAIFVRNKQTGNYCAVEIYITGSSKMVYRPDRKHPSGAKLWIETLSEVIAIGKIAPPPSRAGKLS